MSETSKAKIPSRDEAKTKIQKGVETAQGAVSNAGGFITPVIDGVVDALGGYSELDRKVRKYNPAFHRFCETSFLKKLSFTNKPTKFLILVFALTIVQMFLPIFKWIFDFFARMLGFLFLYNGGLAELKTGYASQKTANQVKAYLTTLLILSAIQLIPAVLFDTSSHMGALWGCLVPVFLFICPDWNPDQPIAVMICDSVFASLSLAISSVIPTSVQVGFELKDGVDVQGDQSQNLALLAGVVVAGLFWIGAIGATASYLATWSYMSFSTINALGADLAERTDPNYKPQMIIWHNLLAIWLWRYFVSAIEAIGIPGIVSVLGLLLYYIPTYFLWMTGFFFLMLVTKKIGGKEYRADTWYARWLLLGLGRAVSRETSTKASPPAPKPAKPQESATSKPAK